MRSKVCLCLIFALGLCAAKTNAQQNFPLGKTIDTVEVENSGGETFSLYLPTSLNENKGLNSIIFVFDPAARGSIGIAPFVEVSEKYGHIVVCSNNSRNGPADKNFEIANRLFAHIFNNFDIDEKQMFLAGFSGGSRLVTSIATLTNQFSGVIACGAGFSNDSAYTPSFQDFIYAGICGNEDMNYQEMRANKSILDQLRFKNSVFTFNGGHRWPPREEINRAFRWIHTMMGSNKNGLDDLLAIELKETRELKDSMQLLMAGENYQRIIGSFKSLGGDSPVRKEFKSLLNSKEYKNAVKEQQRAFELESTISKRLFNRFFTEYESPKNANMAWWSKEFEKLDKIIGEDSEYKSRMAKRVKYKVFAAAYARGNPNLFASNDDQMEYCGNLKLLIYPK